MKVCDTFVVCTLNCFKIDRTFKASVYVHVIGEKLYLNIKTGTRKLEEEDGV